jgi:ABC-2 type transport system ATP-binding protein
MKQRALIAKALSHEPKILFLDEPTAGVDINLRQDMWRIVNNLRKTGVTIILTTHYLEEAEAIADRVSIINNGEIILTDSKSALLSRLGQKMLEIELQEKIHFIPDTLHKFNLSIGVDQKTICYVYDTKSESTGITDLLQSIKDAGLKLRDLQSSQTSLENIFLKLVEEAK